MTHRGPFFFFFFFWSSGFLMINGCNECMCVCKKDMKGGVGESVSVCVCVGGGSCLET